jgi:hypothetical protein
MFSMVESPSKSKKPKPGAAASRDAHFFEEVMGFLVLFAILFSLLWQGLLFEVQKTPAILLFSLLFSVVIIKTRLTGGFADFRLEQPFALCVFLLLTGASLLSLFNAVYMHNAMLALSRNCSLLLLALTAKILRGKIPFAQWTLKAFAIAGAVVALLGIDGVWGGHITGAINGLLSGGALPEGGQGFLFQMVYADRLSSLFQYPNTTAAFLLAAWFATTHQCLHEGEDGKNLKGYNRNRIMRLYLLPGLANLIFLAFVLTVSRGMYLISVPAMLAYYLLLPKEGGRNPLPVLLVCFVPALLTGLLALPGNALRGAGPAAGWAATAALFAATAVLRFGLNSRRHKQEPPENRASATAKPGHKAATETSPRRIKAPVLILAAAVIGALLILLAWQSSTPFAFDDGQPLVRQFEVKEAGDYQLRLRFAQPVDEPLQSLSILLTGQNRKEMLQGQHTLLIEETLAGYSGQNEIQLPLAVKEPETYVQLNVAGSMAGNQLLAVELTNSQEKTAKIKLGRYLFSESLVQRIETILNPKSMYDRFGFYVDAWHIFLDFPLTGIGGDSWSRVYHSYQNFFYTANDIHSYAVQLAVEYGVLGLVALAAIITGFVAALVGCVRKRGAENAALLVMAGALFLHSLIDVDFAFYSEYALFALLFSLLDLPLFNGAAKSGPKQGGQEKRPKYLAYLRAAAVLAIMLAACLLPFRFNRAINQTMTSAYSMEAGDLASAIALSKGAVKNDPFRPEYKALTAIRLAMAKVMPAGPGQGSLEIAEEEILEMQALAAAAEAQGRYSADTFVMLVEYYYNTGQFEKAYAANTRLTELEPFLQEYWLGRGQLIEGILEQYADADEAEQRKAWLEKGAAIPREMKETFAEKWTELQPGDELLKLATAWQEELAALL